MIPVIEKEVVRRSGIVSEEEFNNHVTIACITPGALPVEVAVGIGHTAAGNRGMVAAASAMALPGSLMTMLLLIVLSGMTEKVRRPILWLAAFVSLFIVWTLVRYAYETVRQADRLRDVAIYAFLIVAVFAAARVLKISTVRILILAFAGIIMIATVQYMQGKRSGKKKHRRMQYQGKNLVKSLLTWVIFLAVLSIPALLVTGRTIGLAWRGMLSTVMSFGGGDAYLSVAQGMFVDEGFISNFDFYGNIVAVANVLPGSILCKTLTGIGYMLGYRLHASVVEGICVAVCGFAVSVATSGLIFEIVYAVYERYENLRVFRIMKKLIRPIISGLLLNVALTLVEYNILPLL